MKRQIKFRGVDSFTGEYRYGFYRQTGDGENIIENGHAYLVDKNSIAQLVGYDMDGHEIYEGDLILEYDDEEEAVDCPENGKICKATLYFTVHPPLYRCKFYKEAKS